MRMPNQGDTITHQCDEWTYDVFLSFRGKDTRESFTGSLYRELFRKGLNVFIDDEGLKGGDEIKRSLFHAIQQSRMSIVVFSENYASSRWCLNELVEIVKCMESKNHIVCPVFYKVSPSDVRYQKNSFAKAMAKHLGRSRDGPDNVQKWISALSQVADLSGSTYNSGYEYKFIEEIVEQVNIKLQPNQLDVDKDIVGHMSRIMDVKSLLHIESYRTVWVLGIYGTGGMGKTTLARALFNSIVNQFECAIFLEKVREKSNGYMGILNLQKAILSKLSDRKIIELGSASEGVSILKRSYKNRRVLLVLDDIDRKEQLENLAGECSWFGIGSRIIVTTRDKNVLNVYGDEDKVERYEMEVLNYCEAIELFSRKAFKGSQRPPMNYMGVANRVIHYAYGLPLALRVIGSNLAGKTVEQCEGALKQYEEIPPHDIQSQLKISYDCLEDPAKSIFLDIACFFKGQSIQYVKQILENSYSSFSYNIEILVEKSLIRIQSGCLWMHDLIQDMGKEVIRKEAPSQPGKRSRLYFYQDVIDVLENNLGSNKIEGIMLDPPQEVEVDWSGSSFEKMNNLRILIIRKTRFTQNPSFLPKRIRVLEWEGYPSNSLPLNFHPNNIIDLSLPNSHLILKTEKLFQKEMKCLTRINFSQCDDLTYFPDVTGIVPNLRELELRECRNLVKIHPSVGSLPKLQVLDACDCILLQDIPTTMSLPALLSLDLRGTSIPFFPDMEKMTSESLEISLAGCVQIKKLPGSITNLMGLEELNFSSSSLTLGGLPSEIFTLPKLNSLYLHRCGVEVRDSFRRLLKSFHVMLATTGVDGASTSSSQPPPRYSPLRKLYCSYCGLTDEDILMILRCFPNLEQLSVDGNGLVSPPASIRGSSNLRYLDVSDCMDLEDITQLPESIQTVYAYECISLSSAAVNTLWSLALNEVSKLKVVMSGTEIPHWFDNCCEGRVVSFWVRRKFPVLAVAFILNEDAICKSITLWINGDIFEVFPYEAFERGNVFYFDLQCLLTPDQEAILDNSLVHDQWNKVAIECNCYNDDEEECNVRSCGAYLYRRETNMEDIRFTYPDSSREGTLSMVDDDLPPRKRKRKHMEEAHGGTSSVTFENRINDDMQEISENPEDTVQAEEVSTSRFSHGCCGVLEYMLKFTLNLCLGFFPFLHGRN